MRQEAKLGRLLSILFIVILSLSMFLTATNATIPQSNGSSLTNSQYDSAQIPSENNGTYVNWFQESESITDEWSQTRMNWLFGPSPSFEIFHENGSLLTGEHYAQIDEKLTFSVVVPQTV
ncbi:MAG: hypothetical protein KAJ36_02680, partial [Candidatus Thorarchaeota archaeon]|nr:hypothetical protein [Candidatus Thorarchaeota archaeon]